MERLHMMIPAKAVSHKAVSTKTRFITAQK